MILRFRRGGDGPGGGDGGRGGAPFVPPGPEFYFLLALVVPCCGCPLTWLISLLLRR